MCNFYKLLQRAPSQGKWGQLIVFKVSFLFAPDKMANEKAESHVTNS